MTHRKSKISNIALAASAVLALFGYGNPAFAALTDLSDGPLLIGTTTPILPNIALVIDDSGSMDEENLPDSNSTNRGLYCYKWYKYNALAYNPNLTYTPPIKANGTRFPNASFTSALMDGYFASGEKMYNGSTTNIATNLTTLVTTTGTNSAFAKVWMPDFSKAKENATSVKVTLLDNSVVELLGSAPVPSTATTDEDVVGQAIADAINDNTSVTGFSASYSTRDSKPSTGPYAGTQFFGMLTITAPPGQYGLTTTPAVSLDKTEGRGSVRNVSAESFVSTIVTVNGLYYATANDTSRTACDADIDYTRVTDTANIAAPNTTAGSTAALTNYANWYSYYRKRAFLMKAAVGEAFSTLNEDAYRIGLFTIDSIESEVEREDGSPVNHDLAIDTFTGKVSGTHRATWYDRLYSVRKALYTPLRGALSRMGRMYAGKISGWDPVQHSCQRNFTILTTDGYWNTNAEVTRSYGPYQIDNSTTVDDQDGSVDADGTLLLDAKGKQLVPLPSYDKLHVADTLADVAYYYYHTDLRTSALGNCDRLLGSGGKIDLCENNVPKSGANADADDTATHQHMTTFTLGLGVNGTLPYRMDYRTAGSGSYFDIMQGSTNWPDPINNSGGERIDDLWHAAVNGRGRYFSARDPESLGQSLAATLLEIESTIGSGAAVATGSLQPADGEDNKLYRATFRTKFWDGDIEAITATANTGELSKTPDWLASTSLDARVSADPTDITRRTIYVDVAGVRKAFTYDNLNSTQQSYFDSTKLSQYAAWTADEKAAGTNTASLIGYLRGQFGQEDQDGNSMRLYRYRGHVLGDIGHAQPLYVKSSSNRYTSLDSTFGNRPGMVYVAANDGMLHAFCTQSTTGANGCTPGQEAWAFVIPTAMKDMWYLADKRYTANHRYLVDGPLSAADVYMNGAWRTILVGGLGKGGRGYYAFDITDPTNPQLLWTFTADNAAPHGDPNMGYSYGAAIISKFDLDNNGAGGDTEWRVVLPSGYNNADGGGHLFILDPASGELKSTISTGNGTEASPSGLAMIQSHVPDLAVDNTAKAVYGGDLDGDMWRFDLTNQKATRVIGLGTTRPITTAPIVSTADGRTILYFGTGRYLDEKDLSDTSSQVIVAIRADASDKTIGDLTEQTGTQTIDWGSDTGWYLKLTGGRERVHLTPKLYFGTLMFATVLPNASACTPAGTSREYFMDYKSGKAIDGNSLYVSFDSPLVGFSAVYVGGKLKIYGQTGDGKTELKEAPFQNTSGGGGTEATAVDRGKRIMWRELIN